MCKLKFLDKIKNIIVELWQKANIWQKVGIGIVVLILLFIKIIKWVFLLSLLSSPFVWFCGWFCKGFSGLAFKEQLTAVGAFITAVIAVWRLIIADANKKIADKTLRTEQKKELHERYARAVELLSNPDEAVRMGGLYSLKQIAEENDGEFFDQCKDIIAGYVRNTLSSEKWKESKAKWEEEYKVDAIVRRFLSEDVRIGINILSALAKSIHFQDKYINLQDVDFAGINFDKYFVVFYKINFKGANFNNTILPHGADLSSCYFEFTEFQGAILHRISFEDTYLSCTDFRGALLDGCNFKNAVLDTVLFKNASLSNTNLDFKDFFDTYLDMSNNLYYCYCNKRFLTDYIINISEGNSIDVDSAIDRNEKFKKLFQIWYKNIASEIKDNYCVIQRKNQQVQ